MSAVVTRWWWLRHAPVANPDGIFYGQLDFEADLSASDLMMKQARQLPAGARWFVTPLRRTRETAEALQSAAGVDCLTESEPALIEQDFGRWQGRRSADVYAAFGRDHPIWDAPSAFAPPHGESFEAMMARVQARIIEMTEIHAGRDLIVVAHGGTIRAAMALALGLDGQAASTRLSVDTLSLTRLDHIDDGESPVWLVEAFNVKPT
ncbi:MAG: histidine phosphatase family protein [Pseudomonadota bacterium]